jgi:tRNA wybutosine-synthesizing protein 1
MAETTAMNELETLKALLIKQKYHIVGAHSAVKKCRWLHQSLVKERACYKQKFFGIESHRCVQMTPALYQCTQRCLWCWRVMPEDLGLQDYNPPFERVDEPREIIEGCLREQKRILSGYRDLVKKGVVRADKLEEAMRPNNFAISLAGEPTLYPRLGELISELKRMSFTVFLVTNGTNPGALKAMDAEPTQLYVTVGAPTQDIYDMVTRPIVKDAFRKLVETLSLLSTLSCPTVFRITSAKGLNMIETNEYSRLALFSNPTYIEVKGAMSVGYGTKTGRMGPEKMPTMAEVMRFADEIAGLTGYKKIASDNDSKVVLLSRLDEPIRFR